MPSRTTPLTIIHTEASDAWGGQDIRVFTEALWLRDQGHRVHLFTPAHGELFRRARAAGLDCEATPFAKRTKLVDFVRLTRRFKAIRPDVVCTHSSVDSWVGLTAARACKVPATIRYRHVSTPVGNNFMNRWQYRGLCDHVVTTAGTIRDELLRTLSKRSRESPFASRILLPGHQEDVWPFFRGLDVAVLASTRNEGIPQAGLQAMFAECPFVGTEVGGIPEIVDHQRTGLLVPPGDPAALAAAIMRVLRDSELGAAMADNALNLVRSEFTLSSMGCRIEALLHRLMDAASRKSH